MPKFDRGVKFIEIKQSLIEYLDNYFNKDVDYITENINNLIYVIISLISLRNGSRISESIKAFKLFIVDTDVAKVEVKISKRKDGKNRFMFLPDNITKEMLIIVNILNPEIITKDDENLSSCIRYFLNNRYKINTHTLRYAFINHLLDNDTAAETVSRIVGHKSLNTLNNYIRDTRANKELENFNFNNIENNSSNLDLGTINDKISDLKKCFKYIHDLNLNFIVYENELKRKEELLNKREQVLKQKN